MSFRKGLSPLNINPNAALAPTLPSMTQQDSVMASRTESTERNIMAEESPGVALFAQLNTAVIDPPDKAVVAPPVVRA